MANFFFPEPLAQVHLGNSENVRQGLDVFEDPVVGRCVDVDHAEGAVAAAAQLKPPDVDVVAPKRCAHIADDTGPVDILDDDHRAAGNGIQVHPSDAHDARVFLAEDRPPYFVGFLVQPLQLDLDQIRKIGSGLTGGLPDVNPLVACDGRRADVIEGLIGESTNRPFKTACVRGRVSNRVASPL